MRASAIEFRLRMVINAAIIILGFWAPWIEHWHIGRRISLLEWLALELSRAGIMSFSVATTALLILAALIAAKAVVFRVWGTAYLGAGTVNSMSMVAGTVMADGPYRYMRNPLYIGLWCMVIALAFLMPASGAVFAVILAGCLRSSPDSRRRAISYRQAAASPTSHICAPFRASFRDFAEYLHQRHKAALVPRIAG